MLSVDHQGNITINKGDTFIVPLFIDVSKDIFHSIRLPLKPEYKIFFYLVEPNSDLKHYLIKQTYSSEDMNDKGDILIKFLHEDTSWICPGTYYYEMKAFLPLDKEDPNINEDALITIIPRRKFIIL